MVWPMRWAPRWMLTPRGRGPKLVSFIGEHPDADDGSQAQSCFTDGDGLDASSATLLEGYSFAAQESVHSGDREHQHGDDEGHAGVEACWAAKYRLSRLL
jgi:hypothetical protein